jgi:hypothetical protein
MGKTDVVVGGDEEMRANAAKNEIDEDATADLGEITEEEVDLGVPTVVEGLDV